MARPARAAKPTDLTEKDAAPLGSDDDAASSNGKGDDDDDDASVVESAAAAPAKAEAPKKPRARKPASKLKKKAPIGGQGTAGAGAAPMTATLRAAVAAPAPLAGWKAAPLGPGAALDAYAAPRLALADGAVLAAGAGAGGADDCFANCGAAARAADVCSSASGGGDLVVAAAVAGAGGWRRGGPGPAAALAAVPEEFDALLAKRSAAAAAAGVDLGGEASLAAALRDRRAAAAAEDRGGARVEVWACGAGGCARRYAFRADALDVRWVRGAPAPGALGVLVALTNDGAVEARALPAATTGRLHRIPAAWRFAAPGRRATCVRLSPLAPARAAVGFDDGSCAVADLSPDGASEALVVLAGAPRRDRPAATGAAVRALAWCPAADACLALANESGHVQVWSLRDAAFPLWEDRFSDRCASLGLAWHPSGACLLSGGAVPGNFSGAVLRLDVSKGPDEKKRSTVAYRHAEGTAVLDLDALLVPAAGGDRVEVVLASAGGDGALRCGLDGPAKRVGGFLPRRVVHALRAEAAAPPAAAEAAADGGTVDGAVLAALRAAEAAAARAGDDAPAAVAVAAAPADDPGPLDDRDVAVCSARLGAGDALGYVVSAAACGLLRLQKVTGEPGDDETVDEPEPEPPKKPKAKEAPKKPRGRPKKAEDAAGDGDAAPKKPRGRPKKAAAPPPPPDEEDEDLVCKPKRRSAPVEEEDAEEEDAEDAPEDAPAPKKPRGRPRKQPPPEDGEPPAPKKPRGRPRKHPLPEAAPAEDDARPFADVTNDVIVID